MVYASNFWLNIFPPADGISTTLSPRAIVVGMQVDYAEHCKLEFSTYVQTHEEHENSMATRTTGAIALRPTGNEQGGHYFLSITTGRRLNRDCWTELPMPAEVIERVHTLARRSGAARGLTFTDQRGNLLPDTDDDADDDDETYQPDDDAEYDDDELYENDVDIPVQGVNTNATFTANPNPNDNANDNDTEHDDNK
jgi:hypothetical protein